MRKFALLKLATAANVVAVVVTAAASCLGINEPVGAATGDAKHRLKFVQRSLQYESDRDSGLASMRDRYAEYLPEADLEGRLRRIRPDGRPPGRRSGISLVPACRARWIDHGQPARLRQSENIYSSRSRDIPRPRRGITFDSASQRGCHARPLVHERVSGWAPPHDEARHGCKIILTSNFTSGCDLLWFVWVIGFR